MQITTLEQALVRIAELEAELATRPKRRAPRKPAQPQCQYCGDVKEAKTTFLGLPLCTEWKKCASRIRRNRDTGRYVAFAYDRRYRTERAGERWVARFEGEAIGFADTQGNARALAYADWKNQQVAEKELGVAA